MITALYHWETLYPTFTLDFPKDPNELVIKSPEKKEDKEGEKLEDGEKKEEIESSAIARLI